MSATPNHDGATYLGNELLAASASDGFKQREHVDTLNDAEAFQLVVALSSSKEDEVAPGPVPIMDTVFTVVFTSCTKE